MIVYGATMFLMAVVFAWVGVAIGRGNIDLIHDYHRQNVTNKAAYGKAFGRVMGALAVVFAISGVIGLLDAMILSVAVLLVGLTSGVLALLRVQKRYNGGLFSEKGETKG